MYVESLEIFEEATLGCLKRKLGKKAEQTANQIINQDMRKKKQGEGMNEDKKKSFPTATHTADTPYEAILTKRGYKE